MKIQTWKKMLRRVTAISIVVTVTSLPRLYAQNQLLTECENINKFYRTTQRLSFDMKYTYAKAAHPAIITDSASASYRMDGSRYRMIMGDAEFMQNDSFRIAVMGPERMMNISLPVTGSRLSLPMDQWDSLFRSNDFAYAFEKDGVHKKFTVTSHKLTTSFFRKMEVWYEPDSYRLSHVRYTVDESVFDQAWVQEGIVSGELMIVDIIFNNYQSGRFAGDIFNSTNYFSKTAKEYIPAPAYAGFEVFISSPGL